MRRIAQCPKVEIVREPGPIMGSQSSEVRRRKLGRWDAGWSYQFGSGEESGIYSTSTSSSLFARESRSKMGLLIVY
jgi:hypothetical protein